MAATLLSSHRYLKLWLYNWIEEGIVRDYLVTTHWSQVISQSVFNTIPLYFVVRLVDRKQHGDLTPSSWSAWCLTWEFSQNDLSILGWWIWITILHTMSSPNMLCGEIWPKGERGGRGWGGGGWDGVRDGWWSRRRELSGSTCNKPPALFQDHELWDPAISLHLLVQFLWCAGYASPFWELPAGVALRFYQLEASHHHIPTYRPS